MVENSRIILNYAEYLNEITEVNEARTYYLEQAVKLEYDVPNMTVILLTMCINKELHIVLQGDEETSVEEFPNKLKRVHKEIMDVYQRNNELVNADLRISNEVKSDMLEYLNHMVKTLLSGIKYIEKDLDASWHEWDKWNEWNTRYRREERIRDNMKALISKDGKFTKFTIKHKIEIPYMYTLAWDLPNLFVHFRETYHKNDKEIEESKNQDDTSYLNKLWENTGIGLRFLSNNMIDILLHGVQTDYEKYEDDDPDACIRFYKSVYYEELLPTLEICEKVDYNHDLHDKSGRWKAEKTHRLPLIKKEVLADIPLLSMKSEERHYTPIKAMTIIIDLLKEENKTKDYLESDLVYLKNVVVEICKMVLGWIWENDQIVLQIEEEKAKDYLDSIGDAVSNIPRKNEGRDAYVTNLTNIIAKMWESEYLRNVIVDDNCVDSYTEYAYFSVLKLARNWNEHNLIKNPSITFAVFLFIISIRYIVDINQLEIEQHREYLYEESKLFKFFKKEKIDYKRLNVDETVDLEYKKMYQKINTQAFGIDRQWAKYFPKDINKKDAHLSLTIAGHKESLIKNKMSEYEIYLAFWLSIHLGKEKNRFQKAKDTDLNLIALLEYTYSYQKLSFLLEE